jgi:hypothetical protein
VTSPQRDRHSIAAIRDRGRIGREPANVRRIESHFQAVSPKHLLASVGFEIDSDSLEAFGVVDILFMPSCDGILPPLGAEQGAEKQRAGQPFNGYCCGNVAGGFANGSEVAGNGRIEMGWCCKTGLGISTG